MFFSDRLIHSGSTLPPISSKPFHFSYLRPLRRRRVEEKKKRKKKMLGLKCETMFRPSRRRISFRRRFRKWRSELSLRTSKRPSRQSGKLRTALPALPDCCSGIYGADTRRQKPGVSAREISRRRQETRAGNSARG